MLNTTERTRTLIELAEGMAANAAGALGLDAAPYQQLRDEMTRDILSAIQRFESTAALWALKERCQRE